MLTLRIDIVDCSVTKSINFAPTLLVHDACQVIREKVPEALAPTETDVKNYGLFYTEENKKTGIWLEAAKTLEYYVLRNGDILEYKKKIRTLKVRMLDDSVKTLHVDDSHTVSQIMITICTKIGIANHEEYSLVRDVSDSEREKTMTMKRDKSIARDQKKMDEMKKKLHTDDELDWLDHNKTLREQGVDEKATLLLRRKYFFTDQNIDVRDPVQLHLLYVQTRDNIMKGALPVSQERAVEFAGLQCQVQYGDYNERKHKPGFLELKEVLPKEYCRTKGIEKKIYSEQAKLIGLSDLDAKAKYTQLARSLPTYGMAFFLVKEKMKGKNKLHPALLGITKENVVKIDNEKKEIVKIWPLTTVKRWAPSPNTFTLDFGDYADDYYCVQTLEGEQIAQLISGYIDIILKKKQAKDHVGNEGEEESTMHEDSVCASKATIIQHQSVGRGQAITGNVALPALLRSSDMDASAACHHMQQPMHSNVSQLSHLGHRLPSGQSAGTVGLGGAQRALVGRIGEGLQAVSNTQQELNYKADLPPLGNDPGSRNWRQMASDNSRQRLSAQLSSLNTATAQVVLLTAKQPDTDYTALASAVQTITSGMGNFSKDVRMLAALSEGDGLLDAARSLVGAFSELLQAAQGDGTQPRQRLLNAANRVGEASEGVLSGLQQQQDGDEEGGHLPVVTDPCKAELMTSARLVASCASELVRQAKNVSGACGSKDDQNAVVEAATTCALSSSQLVACTRVLAATIDQRQCQEQLVEAVKCVADSVHQVVAVSEQVCEDGGVLNPLKRSAQDVTQALEQLLHMLSAGTTQKEGSEQLEAIMLTTERLCDSSHITLEVVKQTRTLAEATTMLVNSLKAEAEGEEDFMQQNKLLTAAKQLADATARMVEAAKGCATHPKDPSCKGALQEAAEHLRSAAALAVSGSLKTPLLHNLQQATRKATTAATQLIYAAETAGQWNSSIYTQQQLNSVCTGVSEDVIPKLNQALRQSHREQSHPEALSRLSSAAEAFIQPCNKLLHSTSAALPTISDQPSSLLLNNALKSLSTCLNEVTACLARSKQACSSSTSTVTVSPFEAALKKIDSMEEELEEMKKASRLVPLPGDSFQTSCNQLGSSSKAVATAMAHLLTAATQGREVEVGACSRGVAECLQAFSGAVRGVVATSGDRGLVDYAVEVVHKAGVLVREAGHLVADPSSLDTKNKLAMATKVASQALTACVSCMPGVKEVEQAFKKVNDVSHKVDMLQQHCGESNNGGGGGDVYRGTECSVQQVQLKVNTAAGDLDSGTQDLLLACQSGNKDVAVLSQATNQIAKTYESLMDEVAGLAMQTKDSKRRQGMLHGLQEVSSSTSRFLVASKALLCDPETSSGLSPLTQAARQVSDSISNLINVCTTAPPSHKQCDNAVRHIQSMKLLSTSAPDTQASYHECLEAVVQCSKDLAGPMTSMPATASEASEAFCASVAAFEASIVAIVQHTAHAAYLVGVGAEGSQEGRAALIDHSQVATAAQTIESACSVLSSPSTDHQQVLTAISTIAQQTSLLCNACRHASSRTPEASVKAAFVQCAKDLANNTASMVKAMKTCTEEGGGQMHEVGGRSAQSLLQCLGNMQSFVQDPSFAALPASISPEGVRLQQPLKAVSEDIIEHSCGMLAACKSFSASEPASLAQYSSHSHALSDALKTLLASLRSQLPGEQECQTGLQQIDHLIREVDHLSLEPRDLFQYGEGFSMQTCHDQAVNSVMQVRRLVEPLQMAAKGRGNLAHMVTSATSYLNPFKQNLLACVAKTTDSRQQAALLAQSKTVAECLHNLILLAKQAAAGVENKESVGIHAALDEAADECTHNIDTLVSTLTSTASNHGVVTMLLDHINRSMSLASKEVAYEEGAEMSEHQTNMVTSLKMLTKTAQEMNVKAATGSIHDIGLLAGKLTEQYAGLVQDSVRTAAACPNAQMATRLNSGVHQLGGHCLAVVQAAGALTSRGTDAFAKKDLDQSVKKLLESATDTLTMLHSSARGTQACITACSSISGIIADLDTSAMFAQAATLSALPNDSFANYREEILKTAFQLVEDTKHLVAGAALQQEQLAEAATKATSTIDFLSNRIKMAAASLGSDQNEAQVLLLNATRDVASALNDLISVSKVASGKPPNHPVKSNLKEAAKVTVSIITSLLKNVKTVEDKACITLQAVENSIEALSQEIKAYGSTEWSGEVVSPDQVIQATRSVAVATSKAVAAANSGRQDDMVAAANLGRRALCEVLRSCKGGVHGVEDRELKERLLQGGLSCAEAFKQLLLLVQEKGQTANVDLRQHVAVASKQVALAVTEVVHAAEAIKGVDWADPQDPSVIAEAELLNAASSIEAAARKLGNLRPKLKPKEADETLNFEEQLLHAAKSITTATSALVRAASAAQKELLMQGKVGQSFEEIDSDSQWSQGLISAAKLVALATHSLCDAANAMVQGQASEERLISAAKQVASTTAQLLLACKVKASPNSQAMRRLQTAGQAVKKATEALVKEAQGMSRQEEEAGVLTKVNTTLVAVQAQEINARECVIRAEKELEKARKNLVFIRNAKPPQEDEAFD